jgi:arylsulfatase A-like enzyme
MDRGFDEFYGTVANTPFFKPPNFIDSRVAPEIRPVTDESFYTTDAYAARAVDWIERNRAKPFFLYLPFNAQHAPLQAPQRYLDRFPQIADARRRTFAAMMSAMDDAVGRVLEKLREIGQESNSLVFFLSDNGGPTAQTTSGNGPLRGFKAQTLEGGIRVPFAVQWKGKVPAGKVYEAPVIQLDILPTALKAAGGRIEGSWGLDGVDLVPYLTGRNRRRPHEALFWRFGQQWAVRKGDWKLVAARPDQNVPKLYHLVEDIGEKDDRSAANPEKRKELQSAYDAWNREQVAPLWGPPAPARRPARTRPMPGVPPPAAAQS